MMNSAVVIKLEPEHYLTPEAVTNLPALPLSCLSLTHSRVMKQVLLGITAMFAKVFLCERPQPCRVQFSRPRKILFPQNPLDPDVDRERAQALVGKEHHTISNLCAHARQLAKRARRSTSEASTSCSRSTSPRLQLAGPWRADSSRDNRARIRASSFSEDCGDSFALTEMCARTESANRCAAHRIARRSFCEICRMCATCFIDEQMNVARHSHFGCRMIRRPRQKLARRVHRRIVRKRRADFRERMIEREIMRDLTSALARSQTDA